MISAKFFVGQLKMGSRYPLSGVIMANRSKLSFHSTTTQASAKEKNESQGHVKDPSNAHKKDPQSQAARSGEKARSPSNQALDAASPHEKQRPQEMGGGNKEGIGFVDQVGGQSASARHFEEKDKKNT